MLRHVARLWGGRGGAFRLVQPQAGVEVAHLRSIRVLVVVVALRGRSETAAHIATVLVVLCLSRSPLVPKVLLCVSS